MEKKEIDQKAIDLKETFNKRMDRVKKYPPENAVWCRKPKEYAWRSAS